MIYTRIPITCCMVDHTTSVRSCRVNIWNVNLHQLMLVVADVALLLWNFPIWPKYYSMYICHATQNMNMNHELIWWTKWHDYFLMVFVINKHQNDQWLQYHLLSCTRLLNIGLNTEVYLHDLKKDSLGILSEKKKIII